MKSQRELIKLKAWLSDARKVAIVGIGNTMRKDDAVGVEVVKLLQGKISSKVILAEAETTPENYLDQIFDFQPSHVLVIDSGLIGKRPGNIKLFAPTEDTKTPISTHMLPIQVFCTYLEKAVNAKTMLLIVQPKSADFGEGLTEEVAGAGRKIADFLIEILP